jgi:hypothetical protein
MTIDALIRTVLRGLPDVRWSADHRVDFDDIKRPSAMPLLTFVAGAFAVLVYRLADIAVRVAA